MNLVPRDEIRRVKVTSFEDGIARGYVRGDNFEIEWVCTNGTASTTDAHSW